MPHTNDVTFSLLTPEDTAELLNFETREREWFEKHIEARSERFYTFEGVAQHIVECLALHARGRFSPLIIRARGVMVGRANLRDIADGHAKVGYRIAQSACGHGLAQTALRRLVKEARGVYGVTSLTAIVSVDNVASQRVLEKAGFNVANRLPCYSLVNGQHQDCLVMSSVLPS